MKTSLSTKPKVPGKLDQEEELLKSEITSLLNQRTEEYLNSDKSEYHNKRFKKLLKESPEIKNYLRVKTSSDVKEEFQKYIKENGSGESAISSFKRNILLIDYDTFKILPKFNESEEKLLTFLKNVELDSLEENYNKAMQLKTQEARVKNLKNSVAIFNRCNPTNVYTAYIDIYSVVSAEIDIFLNNLKNEDELKKPLLLQNTKFRTASDVSRETFGYKQNPLIVIRANGEKSFYKSQGEKIQALNSVNPDEDLVLFTWAGEWSSDVFQFTKEDIERLK